MPKRRGYPVYWEEYQELIYYRNQLQIEISQRTTFLNQLKGQPVRPEGPHPADTDVRTRARSSTRASRTSASSSTEIHEKYTAVGEEPQVKKWLETPEGYAGVKPKLGPSHPSAGPQDARAVGAGRGRRGRQGRPQGSPHQGRRPAAKADSDASPF